MPYPVSQLTGFGCRLADALESASPRCFATPLLGGGTMPRRTIRLTAATDEKIEATAKQRGYSSPTALLRVTQNPKMRHPES